MEAGMSEIPTMPIVSKCDRTETCPEPIDHDQRCPKFDADFWANVRVVKRGDAPATFARVEEVGMTEQTEGAEVAFDALDAQHDRAYHVHSAECCWPFGGVMGALRDAIAAAEARGAKAVLDDLARAIAAHVNGDPECACDLHPTATPPAEEAER